MKRAVFLLLSLFIALFFHERILGFCVRIAVQKELDCRLAYRSVGWQNGSLVFSDLVLFDPTFHVHVEKAEVQFNWKTLGGSVLIERPRLTVLQMKSRPLPKGDKWNVVIRDGTVEWGGIAHFSYADNHLSLDWERSALDLYLFEEGIEADLRQFDISLLSPLFPYGEILDGHVTGRAEFDQEFSPVSINLKMEEIALDAACCSVEELAGTFSYNADLGAKWELKGLGVAVGKEFPFTCSGRGFFKSRWIESEVEFEGGSKCKLSGEDVWTFQCQKIHAHEAALLQSAFALIYPPLSDWTLCSGIVSANASFCPSFWNLDFEGRNLLVKKEKAELACEVATGRLSQSGGDARLQGKNYDLHFAGALDAWKMELSAFGGKVFMKGALDGKQMGVEIEKGEWCGFAFTGKGWLDSQFDFGMNLDGEWAYMGRKIAMSVPHFGYKEGEWAFDIRTERKMWDLLRLKGVYSDKGLLLHDKSHLLGAQLIYDDAVRAEIPIPSLLALSPLLKEWGYEMPAMPNEGTIALNFQYDGKLKAKAKSPQFSFSMEQKQDGWLFDLDSLLSCSGELENNGAARGRAKWKSVELEFEGELKPDFHAHFSLPKVKLDLSDLDSSKVAGLVEGQGSIVYDGEFDADFDLAPAKITLLNRKLQNTGPVHLSYSSKQGAMFKGIDLHGDADFVVDHLEYNRKNAHWIFHGARLHFPEYDLDFTADFDVASDFSTLSGAMHQSNLSLIEDLRVEWEKGECRATFRSLGSSHKAFLHMGETITGRLILGEEATPLMVDFDYKDTIKIHSIEGAFCGLEASFHADGPNTLIGSARVDFNTFAPLLPAKVAKVFDEIKMGRGYELKGRVKIDNNIPTFQGLLSGKQLELFGFQFRTLLAQVDLGPTKVRIYDVKISDSAGVMKIDELLLAGEKDHPWTISVPTLTILDLRPSLLQKTGQPQKELTPLVVRELTLTSLKGLLDEGKTYTAKGKLHFINSYKREATMFDKPANVLSRIVGLDLELLIPVCGDLTFDLKNGAFHLLELTNAFSEANRSEFFLEMDPAPSMDLDGNLNIFIKMKQFVLLKFTESFLISVEGKLEDPKYHLQKRRFFGLM